MAVVAGGQPAIFGMAHIVTFIRQTERERERERARISSGTSGSDNNLGKKKLLLLVSVDYTVESSNFEKFKYSEIVKNVTNEST